MEIDTSNWFRTKQQRSRLIIAAPLSLVGFVFILGIGAMTSFKGVFFVLSFIALAGGIAYGLVRLMVFLDKWADKGDEY